MIYPQITYITSDGNTGLRRMQIVELAIKLVNSN